MDYYRGPPQNGFMGPPPSHAMQAPSKYFGGPLGPGSSLGPSQRSNDRSQNSMDRAKRKGKNLRKQGSASQGSVYSSSQGYMQNLMSQESYTAFDDFGMTSQDSHSQNTQDL